MFHKAVCLEMIYMEPTYQVWGEQYLNSLDNMGQTVFFKDSNPVTLVLKTTTQYVRMTLHLHMIHNYQK